MENKVSVIVTVKNEEKTIGRLLDSLFSGVKKPDEVVICDGKSEDKTAKTVENYRKNNFPVKLIVAKSNRAEGRNIAIENASHEIIAVTDGGCIADEYWLERLTEPFKDSEVDIVSGFYQPIIHGLTDKLVYIYTSVTPDKVEPLNFLPSHRSVAFRKSLWRKIGGYPKEMYSSEDLMFNFKAKKAEAKFLASPDAIVYWEPRGRNQSIFRQFYVMAKSSAEFGIVRKNVKWIFGRYLLLSAAAWLSYTMVPVLFLSGWAFLICKHRRWLKTGIDWVILPFFQIYIDFIVMAGTIIGMIKSKRL